jgi:hypothetical protein
MIDILFLAHNRLEFTKLCLANLIKNTNWSEVARLVIYDDESTDGTREYLHSFDPGICKIEFEGKVNVEVRTGSFGSPVAIMNNYLRRDPALMFAKIDSDTMVPSGWLDECLRVMDMHPRVDLLGIEAFRPVQPGQHDSRSIDSAAFIGGIGLMRSRAFRYSMPNPDGKHFGFTAWQEHDTELEKAWLNPALPVFLLDWIPREPFRSLTKDYVSKGWNRDWSTIFPEQCPYPEDRKDLWSWWCE